MGEPSSNNKLLPRLLIKPLPGARNISALFLGEFGAYEKGDIDSRARWTSFVSNTAAAHQFPTAYWEFCSGFGAYDPVATEWRKPLLNALIPPPK